MAALIVLSLLVLAVSGCGGSESKEAARQGKAAPSHDRSGKHATAGKRRQEGKEKQDGGVSSGAAPGIPANAKRTTVTEVTDGDTVELAGAGASRLIGVDTPKVHFDRECFGATASAYTGRRLAPGTQVHYLFGAERTDDFGRALVYLWLGGGTFFNAELVKEGYAVPLTIAPNDRYAGLFRELARKARRAAAGLWSPSTCGGDPDLPVGGGGGGDGGGGGGGKQSGPTTGGDKDCADFSSQSEAQRYFEAQGGPSRDPDRLDADGDGVACESL